MAELTGWLLDLYPGGEDEGGAVLWLLSEDGRRLRLHHFFPLRFYASGPPERLRQLWQWLKDRPRPPALCREERRELFSLAPLPVLAMQVGVAGEQAALFRRVSDAFPDLTFYDADLPLALRYAGAYGVFPLALCRLEADAAGEVRSIRPLDSPWDLDPPPPPLRILSLEPEVDPAHTAPREVLANAGRLDFRFPLEPERPLLVNLAALLTRFDPDLVLTSWGDTWLLPRLLELSEKMGIPLPLNRETDRPPAHHKELSYFSYGQVIHRGRQVHLFGRLHIDRQNAMLWKDYQLEGALEIARVTSLPLQVAARVSPGTGISTMQMLTALRQGILTPWRKQQFERPKSALELFSSDMGGLVYQPIVGLHREVGAIDFISMYPGAMVHFNISPETVGPARPDARGLAELEGEPGEAGPGLVPRTLAPLLHKRIELKRRGATLPAWDPRGRLFKARSTAHKWLLVTCFGYLGYKNARFGRIEAHEAVTAYGREALLRAKEVAEDLGFTVLHMYVDGLWVKKEGAVQVPDFQPLLEGIVAATGLPIALDGIYRWVAFLPSRVDGRVPVANRYFGVFQDGSLKIRGIETRRHDTCPYVAEAQQALIEWMAAQDPGEMAARLPEAVELLRRRLADLRSGRAPVKKLLVSQRLSRELSEYRSPSPAARAAAQLQAAGKNLRPGQKVRFLYTLGDPGVWAWDRPEPFDARRLDVRRYVELLIRAAAAVLQPLGVEETRLRFLLIR